MPCGCLFLTHFALITYRAIFEQKEQRRIRSIFSKIVSPNVVSELLQAEHLSLGGARRQITVFFSDVRGFTEMTDESHARAEEHVRQHQLARAQADAYFDEQAKEVLSTVNRYLGIIADKVKQHEGTLDKYIGDCVMAFWGAPTPNEKHALTCVRAAIDAQRAVYALNQERVAENKRREAENAQRASAGQPALPLLKILSMGTGINTGTVTIGLMGSEHHISNYTVFGRDVNLAARLEGHSGRGRIFIGEATYLELLKDDSALAATCTEQAPITFKGFRTAVKTYEVPWKIAQPLATSGDTESSVAPPQRAAG
jgi:adenylate cyclase